MDAVCRGAEHCAVLPPLLPAQLHDQGPEPPTADAVPVPHRPVVGAELTATPFEEPHAPFTGAIGVTLCVTLMENAASAAVAPPSLTPMMIFEYTLTSAAFGVPDNKPVAWLNVAHDGMFWMLKVSLPPLALLAAG